MGRTSSLQFESNVEWILSDFRDRIFFVGAHLGNILFHTLGSNAVRFWERDGCLLEHVLACFLAPFSMGKVIAGRLTKCRNSRPCLFLPNNIRDAIVRTDWYTRRFRITIMTTFSSKSMGNNTTSRILHSCTSKLPSESKVFLKLYVYTHGTVAHRSVYVYLC
jgi:hypothetical protein